MKGFMDVFRDKIDRLSTRLVTEKTITDTMAEHKIKELSGILTEARYKFNKLQDYL
jgi:uncharacterized coiled-coil protein SlyX